MTAYACQGAPCVTSSQCEANQYCGPSGICTSAQPGAAPDHNAGQGGFGTGPTGGRDAGLAADAGPPPPNSIVGTVCAPNGMTPLGGALAYVDTSVGRIQDVANSQGAFVLGPVPVGTYAVHVRAGVFSATVPGVVVRAGMITQIGGGASECVAVGGEVKLGVVTGIYDDVGAVLARLGVSAVDTFDGISGLYVQDLLLQPAVLNRYDMVFFNCGLNDSVMTNLQVRALVTANLADYVAAGGRIYVSDWAYDLVEQTWPDALGFFGDDLVPNSAQVGADADHLTAQVADSVLETALSVSTVEVVFNLSAWALLTGVGPGARVYLQAPVSVCADAACLATVEQGMTPLTVSFQPPGAAGTVFFTSLHQETQQTPDMERLLELLVFQF